MKKYYYIVSNTVNEYNSTNVAIKESFEDARKIIPNIADWWCNNGSGTITKIDDRFNRKESWSFRDNKLFVHHKCN